MEGVLTYIATVVIYFASLLAAIALSVVLKQSSMSVKRDAFGKRKINFKADSMNVFTLHALILGLFASIAFIQF